MKNLYPLFLSFLLPFILPAQSNFNLKGCAKYWATNQPVKNVDMQVAVYYNSLAEPFFIDTPSPDSLCSVGSARRFGCDFHLMYI